MFNGDLYVGTGRVGCTSSVMSLMSRADGRRGRDRLPGGIIPGNDPQPPPAQGLRIVDGTTVTDIAKYDAFNAVLARRDLALPLRRVERVFQAPLIHSYLAGAPKRLRRRRSSASAA